MKMFPAIASHDVMAATLYDIPIRDEDGVADIGEQVMLGAQRMYVTGLRIDPFGYRYIQIDMRADRVTH